MKRKKATDFPQELLDLFQRHVHGELGRYVYAKANHGFHNDTTPRYDETAAKLAWQRTLEWYGRYLRTTA